MIEAVDALDNVRGDEFVRCVTVVAGGPGAMPGVKPILADLIHDVAVIASGWVVAEIGREVGRHRADDEGGEQGLESNREGKFHAGPVG